MEPNLRAARGGARRLKLLVALAFALGGGCVSGVAGAFPGVLVAKDDAPRSLRDTTIMLVRHHGITIVTLSAEYEGPLTPFAFLVPVPADVRATAVKTLRRAVLARVEALSAPRFHLFHEQDPCDDAPVEQDWDEHVKAKGAGFLAPPGLPPLDRHYAVSNAINLPVSPSFKERESEFTYRELVYAGPEKLATVLAAAGYHAGAPALAVLARELHPGDKLLLVEVSLSHVELSADNRVQLGGMRYVTREPLAGMREALGGANASAPEDVFVYVFDRASRYEVKRRENVRVPLAVRVEPRVAERLGAAYNGLFDAVTARHPAAWVTEFAWPTSGCGEPCPDVPLGPDELLTLGGDVLEAETTSAAERAPEPPEEPPRERERFETHLAELPPRERPAALREHAAERREIERRRALSARQTYVLTRLHRRYAAGAERRDLELVPAPPLEGGIGVPVGARGELPALAREASENHLQVRFFALEAWALGSACASPRRFRWGKRWASEARAPRAVPLALDLPAASRDPRVLGGALLVSFPELGLAATVPATELPAPVASAPVPPAAPKGRGCGVAASRAGGAGGLWVAALGALSLRRKVRLRKAARTDCTRGSRVRPGRR